MTCQDHRATTWQGLDSSSRLSDLKDDSFHHGHGGPWYEQGAAGSPKPVPVPTAREAQEGHRACHRDSYEAPLGLLHHEEWRWLPETRLRPRWVPAKQEGFPRGQPAGSQTAYPSRRGRRTCSGNCHRLVCSSSPSRASPHLSLSPPPRSPLTTILLKPFQKS